SPLDQHDQPPQPPALGAQDAAPTHTPLERDLEKIQAGGSGGCESSSRPTTGKDDGVETEDIERVQPYQLNLGAAKTHIPGFINIDIHENAELTLDLAVDALPFPDNSVQRVVSHHTLE